MIVLVWKSKSFYIFYFIIVFILNFFNLLYDSYFTDLCLLAPIFLNERGLCMHCSLFSSCKNKFIDIIMDLDFHLEPQIYTTMLK